MAAGIEVGYTGNNKVAEMTRKAEWNQERSGDRFATFLGSDDNRTGSRMSHHLYFSMTESPFSILVRRYLSATVHFLVNTYYATRLMR